MKKHFLIISIISFIFIITPAHNSTADETDFYIKIQRALSNFQKVYKSVSLHYAEEFDPYEFVKAGIDGMLKKLDPYTVFIEPEGETNLRIITTGKYGGLGMEIGIRNKKITIISPMDDSPAKRNGIRAGDIIEKINGISVNSLSTQKVSTLLRGPAGTEVELSISRNGYAGEILMNLTRAEIVIEDVTYSAFIYENIAYARLNGFTEKAARELISAIDKLEKEKKIEAFILDIRGNSGGLLESAVEVSNVFLPKNTPVVSTKGFREGENNFKTTTNPILPDIPMVVLVDGGSASASEIVAGALQDLDRAIIVGSETFGKGLVQKVYNVDNKTNTKLKITTAKYYIPSGRCIQKFDYTKNNIVFSSQDTLISNEDKLLHEFYTINNRPVFEKGGISPDILSKDQELSNLIFELYRKGLFFNFSVKYQQENPEWIGDFVIDDKTMEQFFTYLDELDFEYEIEGEKNLKNFLETAQKGKIKEDIYLSGQDLLKNLQASKDEDLKNQTEEIRNSLIVEMADKYFDSDEKIKHTLKNDEQLRIAIDVLKDQPEYNKILAIK